MRKILISLKISTLPFSEALANTLEFAIKRKYAYACFANVHMLVEAWDDPAMKSAVNNADFVFADGMPVAKGLSFVYGESHERIAGMDFIGPFLRLLDENKLRLVVFGGSESSHSEAQRQFGQRFPGIELAFICPPHRIWTPEENLNWIRQINDLEPHVVFVILGCPKQEMWMATHSKQIPGLLLGLGGALPTVLGIQKRAPSWMQVLMLEWLFRLIQEPGRLWKRYAYTNLKFIGLFGWFLLFGHKSMKE